MQNDRQKARLAWAARSKHVESDNKGHLSPTDLDAEWRKNLRKERKLWTARNWLRHLHKAIEIALTFNKNDKNQAVIIIRAIGVQLNETRFAKGVLLPILHDKQPFVEFLYYNSII